MNEETEIRRKKKIYKEIKHLQELAWRNEDLMKQETLYELQECLAGFALDCALACGYKETKDLLDTFPWLYKANG